METGQQERLLPRHNLPMSAHPTPLNDWNAHQYLKFEDERTQPPRDLLAQVPLRRVRMAVDLGCGPGSSTELLVDRYPDATVIGLDSSKDTLRQARERLPRCMFIEADLAAWTPQEPVDLLFANAVFQWVSDHQMVMKRVIDILPEGSVLPLARESRRAEAGVCQSALDLRPAQQAVTEEAQ